MVRFFVIHHQNFSIVFYDVIFLRIVCNFSLYDSFRNHIDYFIRYVFHDHCLIDDLYSNNILNFDLFFYLYDNKNFFFSVLIINLYHVNVNFDHVQVNHYFSSVLYSVIYGCIVIFSRIWNNSYFYLRIVNSNYRHIGYLVSTRFFSILFP